MSDILNFAIVGSGNIGLKHIKAIVANPNAKLVAVCDTVLSQNKYPHFNSLEALLLADLEIDVVNICTPNGLHTAQAIQVLEAGKHVVIEKPMGLTKSSCEKVIHKSLQVGKKVFVVMQLRFNPVMEAVKKLLEAKKLGAIYLVQASCFWNRNESYYSEKEWRGTKDIDGGVLYTQFAHYIDALYWFFGDLKLNHVSLKENRKRIGDTEFPDTGLVSFETAKEVLVNFSFTTVSKKNNFENYMTIISEKGNIKISGQYLNKLDCWELDGIPVPNLNQAEGSHQLMIQNVINAVTKETPMMTNAFEGMKVVEIIENIYKRI